MVSTHFVNVHEPTPIELQTLHSYGGVAADHPRDLLADEPLKEKHCRSASDCTIRARRQRQFDNEARYNHDQLVDIDPISDGAHAEPRVLRVITAGEIRQMVMTKSPGMGVGGMGSLVRGASAHAETQHAGGEQIRGVEAQAPCVPEPFSS